MEKGKSMSVRGQISCPPARETGPHLPHLLAVLCPYPAATPKLPSGITGWQAKGMQKLQSAERKLRVNPLPFLLPPQLMWRGDERGGMKHYTTGKAESSASPQPAFKGTGG